LSSLTVPIVAADPAPKLRVVALIPRVELVVKVVRPEAVIVVSVESRTMVFDEALNVMFPAPPDTNDSAPVVWVKVVVAPSRVISVSAIETAVELISRVEPELTSKVVPVPILSVPDVKVSVVSDLKKLSDVIPSKRSASKPLPEPSFPDVQTVPPVVKVYV